MNARLYDAALGRFLSPDPYVQAPDFSQSFNRYSYCINNPLVYVDCNGYTWFTRFGNWLGPNGRFIVSTVVTIGVVVGVTAICVATGGLGAVAIAAIAGGSSGLVGSALNTAFAGGSAKDFLVNCTIGTAVGAVSGMVGYGVGKLGADLARQGFVKLGMGTMSPVLNGAATGLIGGAAGGYASGYVGGFTSALLHGGSLDDALSAGKSGGISGALMGGPVGLGTGAYGGYKYAKENGLDPWTGNKLIDKNSVGAQSTSISVEKINDAYLKQNGLNAHEIKYEYLGNNLLSIRICSSRLLRRICDPLSQWSIRICDPVNKIQERRL